MTVQEINVHTSEYCDRNIIIKLLMTTVDRDFHFEKVKQLSQLIADAHFSVSAATHSLTVDVHAAIKCMQEKICKETPYKVRQQVLASHKSHLSSHSRLTRITKNGVELKSLGGSGSDTCVWDF